MEFTSQFMQRKKRTNKLHQFVRVGELVANLLENTYPFKQTPMRPRRRLLQKPLLQSQLEVRTIRPLIAARYDR